MIITIKNAVIKNAWLFLAAAWLYTLSFIFTNYISYRSSSAKVASILSKYIQSEERSFRNIIIDSGQVSGIVSDSLRAVKQELVTDAQGIFVYHVNEFGNAVEIFWNTNKMSVEQNEVYKEDGNYMVNYQNGFFELIKKTIAYNKSTYIFCSLIPIHWEYFMQNEYLKQGFAVHEEIGNNYELGIIGNGVPVKSSNGKILFAIKEKKQSGKDIPGGFSIILRITALIILFAFISNIAADIVRIRSFISGFAFLVLSFILMRTVVYVFPFPFDYHPLKIFSSSVYYGSFINNSLGNLLLNSVLLLWMIIFFRRFYRDDSLLLKNFQPVIAAFKYSLFILIPAFTFYTADIISSLVTNSAISFNAADFFSLNIFSFAGFIIICILLYAWLYLTGILFQLSLSLPITGFWRIILFLSCCFLLISLQVFQVQTEILLFTSAFLLFVLLFMETRNNPSFSSLVSSSFFIIWALIVTAAASTLIIYQNNISEKKTRIKLAETIQSEQDSAGTYVLKMALSDFEGNFIENNFNRFQSPESNKFLKDSLASRVNAASSNKYVTEIYSFDDSNHALHNIDSTNYDVINSVVENKSVSTGVQDLYYYKTGSGDYNYIYKKQLYGDDAYLGSVFVLIKPDAHKNDVLVPQLFKQLNSFSGQTGTGYVIGIYENRKLVSAFTGFNFADTIQENQLPQTKYFYTDSLGYNQLWYKVSNDRLIIVAKKNNWLFNFITLFAYLFVMFIMLAFIVHESRRVLEEPVQKFTVRNIFRFNIRTQIQTTIIGVSILSFLIIGISTISFFINRFNKNTTAQLINTAQIIANETKQVLLNDSINLNNSSSAYINENDIEKKITDISVQHNTDINFYIKDGSLLVSSQPYIYNKQIISTKMNPDAFYEMHYNHSTRFVHTETIGNFAYQSIYIPVKNNNDETVAYLNIPSLSSHNELQEEISDFLVTVIILNALIFIFAGAIAVALTGRITSSLELISNKMKEINIGSINQEIIWKQNDEIGLLVDEYNKMVKKLEESTSALVRSERKGAWQQMARQVAHEIKNPLTPMKLSIQYLQRAMDSNADNAVELSKKLAASLIEQIDQLAKIASDFSQFANIDYVNPEVFDLSDVIQNLVNIYNTISHINITYTHDENDMIFCDKAQMHRLFTNLIKNAIEASSDRDEIIIQINQLTENKNVIISFRDNGHGIPESLQQKIFDPNFTTKTSGTGLGLAICKAIVEKAQGRIWFITVENEGTSFYIELPIARNELA